VGWLARYNAVCFHSVALRIREETAGRKWDITQEEEERRAFAQLGKVFRDPHQQLQASWVNSDPDLDALRESDGGKRWLRYVGSGEGPLGVQRQAQWGAWNRSKTEALSLSQIETALRRLPPGHYTTLDELAHAAERDPVELLYELPIRNTVNLQHVVRGDGRPLAWRTSGDVTGSAVLEHHAFPYQALDDDGRLDDRGLVRWERLRTLAGEDREAG